MALPRSTHATSRLRSKSEAMRWLGKSKGRVFASKPILRTFKRGPGRAKIAYEAAGKQADRKCLRKTFCTHLALRGVGMWEAATVYQSHLLDKVLV